MRIYKIRDCKNELLTAIRAESLPAHSENASGCLHGRAHLLPFVRMKRRIPQRKALNCGGSAACLSRQKARIQTPGPAAHVARRGRAPFDPLQIQLSIFYGPRQTIDFCSSIRISIFVDHIIIYAASFHISVARQLNPA